MSKCYRNCVLIGIQHYDNLLFVVVLELDYLACLEVSRKNNYKLIITKIITIKDSLEMNAVKLAVQGQ